MIQRGYSDHMDKYLLEYKLMMILTQNISVVSREW